MCRLITKDLPDWFGLGEANEKYFEKAGLLPNIVLGDKHGGNIGLLLYEHKYDDVLKKEVIDIHWLAILPDYHGKGGGSLLIEALEKHILNEQKTILTVETLDPEAGDPNYLKTFAFYKKHGFETYHHFSYGEKTPMVKMQKTLLHYTRW